MRNGVGSERLALITGAGSGIGAASARRLARDGMRVAVSDVDQAAALRVAGEVRARGGLADALVLDVSLEASWQAALRGLIGRFGSIAALINCAGVSTAGSLAETSLEEWRRVHSVNLDGVFLGTREGIRAMRSRGGGVIVNLAALAGIEVQTGAAAYSASKAAVLHLSRLAARECDVANEGVHVHVLAPGGARTPMWHSIPIWRELAAGGDEAAWRKLDPEGVWQSAEEVAETIAELVREGLDSADVLRRAGRWARYLPSGDEG